MVKPKEYCSQICDMSIAQGFPLILWNNPHSKEHKQCGMSPDELYCKRYLSGDHMLLMIIKLSSITYIMLKTLSFVGKMNIEDIFQHFT